MRYKSFEWHYKSSTWRYKSFEWRYKSSTWRYKSFEWRYKSFEWCYKVTCADDVHYNIHWYVRFIRTNTCIHFSTHKHTHMQKRTHKRTHLHIHSRTYAHIRTYANTHWERYRYICIEPDIYVWLDIYIDIYIEPDIYIELDINIARHIDIVWLDISLALARYIYLYICRHIYRAKYIYRARARDISSRLEIILDLPFGFPINNIISISLHISSQTEEALVSAIYTSRIQNVYTYSCLCVHVFVLIRTNTWIQNTSRIHQAAQKWKNCTLVGHPQYRKANLWYLIFWVNYQLPKEPILKLAFCLSAWSTRVRFFYFWADIKNPSSIHQERLRGTRLALLVQHTAAHSKNCAWSTDFGMDLYVVSAHVDQERLAAKCKLVNMC